MSTPRQSKQCNETTKSESHIASAKGDQAPQNVSTCSYGYANLTDHVVAQNATTPDAGGMANPYFWSDFTFPYQRYSSYDPIAQQSSAAPQAAASYDETVSAHSGSLSYNGTLSNTATPSYNTTSSVVFDNTSSSSIQAQAQAQPNPGQNVYAHNNFQSSEYRNTQAAYYGYQTQEDALAGVGTQFNNDARRG